MGKQHYQLDIVKKGALIKFGDGDYGFVRGDSVEKIDDEMIKLDGYEISSVYIRYLNDLHFFKKDKEMADGAKQGIGNVIKKIRNEKDMNQSDFTVNKWTISELELGKKMPRPQTINSVAESLDMGFAEFLSEASLEMFKEVDNE